MFKLIFIICLVILSLALFNHSNEVNNITISLGNLEITIWQNLLVFLFLIIFITITLVIYIIFKLQFFCKNRKITSNNQKSTLALDNIVDVITATSLGDFNHSSDNLKKLSKNLPKHPIVNLLNLQNNSLEQNYKAMGKDFNILLNNKKTKNFALQGLAMIATKKQDFTTAKLYLEESYQDHPYAKNTIIALLKNYQTQQKWLELSKLITDNYQKKIFTKNSYDQLLALSYLMIYLDNKEIKYLLKARKLYNNHFIIELEYAKYLLKEQKKSALTRYLKKIIITNQQPELLNVFIKNLQGKTAKTQLKYLEKLIKLSPDNIAIIIKYVEISLSSKLKLDDSKKLLTKYLKNSNTNILYDIAVKFYQENNDSIENHDVLESLLKQEKHYQGYNHYSCIKCQSKFDSWYISCSNCHSFNHIIFKAS
jgi:uncharacterized membrane-anchored protein